MRVRSERLRRLLAELLRPKRAPKAVAQREAILEGAEASGLGLFPAEPG